MPQHSILVFSPTYNEYDNIIPLYDAIKKAMPTAHILLCDDNSPDGTGDLIDKLCAQDSTVYVIHRPKKMGTGSSFIAAYNFARQHNFDYLITLDADLTHDPAYIPELIQKADQCQADIVIGSRYAQGGSMIGWNKIRLPFTYFWRFMIQKGLGLPYDCTGAYRLYRVSFLNPVLYNTFTSRAFSFCMESLYRFCQAGARIQEVPIIARSRVAGTSKLSYAIMKEVFTKYCQLLADRLGLKRKNLFESQDHHAS